MNIVPDENERFSIYEGLKPHPDYDFVHDDAVCYDIQGEDGTVKTQYSILQYEPELSAFMLVNFTDETYTTVVPNIKGGLKQADFLFEVGIEILEKVEEE